MVPPFGPEIGESSLAPWYEKIKRDGCRVTTDDVALAATPAGRTELAGAVAVLSELVRLDADSRSERLHAIARKK